MSRKIARVAVALACACIGAARGHETDQYALPVDRPFADLADYLDTVHCIAVEKAVARLNDEIAGALRIDDPRRRAERLAVLHGPRRAADLVYASFATAGVEVLDMEMALRSGWAHRAYPDRRVIHMAPGWVYLYTHLPVDPRRIPLLFQSSTMRAYGVYFGTDKLAHFHHMGHMYFDAYLDAVARGLAHEQALRSAARAYHDGLLGEWAFLGGLTTGVHSNADLAADYLGLKFFINVTRPVQLKGQVRPPMLVLRGNYWRVNTHVRRESGWFGWYISDHWNEALNPPHYTWGLRASAQRIMRWRAAATIRFYEDVDRRPSDPGYYDALARSLTTYYGEDYGHPGRIDRLLTIGNTCYPAVARAEEAPGAPARAAAAE